MKSIALILMLLTFPKAKANEIRKADCANQAVKAAVEANYRAFDASTSSCGVKAIQVTQDYETLLVCTSDETEVMEYTIVLGKRAGEACTISKVTMTSDSSAPHFDSSVGLLTAVECSISYGDRKTAVKCE
ncbi:MAG: hypothetical protein H7328_03420 [Bdellovibrio sp.]|nr:hypothetical protein [Bdellovibrio sp.]